MWPPTPLQRRSVLSSRNLWPSVIAGISTWIFLMVLRVILPIDFMRGTPIPLLGFPDWLDPDVAKDIIIFLPYFMVGTPLYWAVGLFTVFPAVNRTLSVISYRTWLRTFESDWNPKLKFSWMREVFDMMIRQPLRTEHRFVHTRNRERIEDIELRMPTSS